MSAAKQPKSRIQVSQAVKDVYKVIGQATGAVGGYGHDGAIYGEITVGTLQKIVESMRNHLDFSSESSFLDIGSGLGKPNLHVAVDPGVVHSFGVELEELRWKLSMHNLRNCLAKCAPFRAQRPNIHFAHADVTDIKHFSPVSHVYMFDVGFPPSALLQIANAFNVSKTVQGLVSFQPPRRIIGQFFFAVELVDKVSTTMHGSSEGHTAYIYRAKRFKPSSSSSSSSSPSSSSLFATPSSSSSPSELADVPSREKVAAAPSVAEESIGARTRRRTRSPVKQKRQQQLQVDALFTQSKRARRSSSSKKLADKFGGAGSGSTPPKVLFPSKELRAPAPLLQSALNAFTTDTSYYDWLDGAARIEEEKRPKRNPVKRKFFSNSS